MQQDYKFYNNRKIIFLKEIKDYILYTIKK